MNPYVLRSVQRTIRFLIYVCLSSNRILLTDNLFGSKGNLHPVVYFVYSRRRSSRNRFSSSTPQQEVKSIIYETTKSLKIEGDTSCEKTCLLHRVFPSSILARTSASVYFPSREDEKKKNLERCFRVSRWLPEDSLVQLREWFREGSFFALHYLREVNLRASLRYRAFLSQAHEIQRYRVRTMPLKAII